MKRTMKKMLSFGLVAAMSLTMLAGCGNSKDATNDTNVSNGQEEKKPTGDVKIGVLVQDVSGEEALGFRSYYENYIADQYGVTFTYTDELKDAASEKSAIEKFASQGYQAVISFSSNCNLLEYLTQRDIQTKNSGVNVRYRGKHRFFKGFNEFIKEKTRRCDNDFEKIERHVFF